MTGNCSIREVARHAGVSAGTVSRVLNNRMGEMQVPETTRQKIIRAAQELNYTPNIHARRLFSNRSGIIGLVVPSFSRVGTHIFENYHMTRIISGLEKGLTGKDYRLLLIFNDDKFVKDKQYLSLFRERNVDALLVWGAYADETFWQELAAVGCPHLFLTNLPSGGEKLNYILSDHEAGSYSIAHHLLERGHRRLIWLRGKPDISLTRQQENGISRALSEYGLTAGTLTLAQGDFIAASGENAMAQLLEQYPELPFSALITANYDMAKGAINVLQQRGIAIPEKIAVAACDSYRGQEDGRLNLTRIEVNDLELGNIAAEQILQLIEHPETNIKINHAVNLIIGQTT